MADSRGGAPLLGLLWASAISARAPILCVGPVLPQIIEDLALSYTAAGFLFSLPVLMMGCLSVPGGVVADRAGATRVIGAALLAIAAAGVVRAGGSVAALFLGTALVGSAIGVLQPALARLASEFFADRVGLATAVYSTGFTGGALLALLATPAWLVPAFGGWQGALLVWSAVAVAAVPGWLRVRGTRPRAPRAIAATPMAEILRDALLWRIALLQAANSAIFFAVTAWLPRVYEGLGWSATRAAWPLAVITAVGGVAGFLGPVLTDRFRARRPAFVWSCVLSALGVAGLMMAPVSLLWPASVVLGAGLFASFTINLTLPVDVSPPARVGAASGFVLSVGHGGSLIGPLVAGALRDLTGDFRAALAWILLLALVMAGLAFTIPETHPAHRTG